MAALDKALNDRDHLRDTCGGTRFVCRALNAEQVIGGSELCLHAIGQCPPFFDAASFGIVENLVVDIRDVAHQSDLVALVG